MKGSDVGIAMLAACLSESGDPGVRGAACNAVRRLLGKIPTRTDAMCLLTDAADNYFSQRQLLDSESEGQVDVWRWDAEKRKCVGRRCDVVDARRALAARWARDAYLIAPENRETQLLHLATLLEAAQYDRGLEQPLEENSTAVVEAKKLGVRLLDDVLARALSGGHVGAAQAAARLLGQLGTADALLYQGTGPAPLVRAVRDANRRVRMAAIQAIIQLKPTKPYPGSSDVPRALKFFAASSGTRRVLAADPILQDARDLGGMLAPHGYQADIAATGKELMKLAASSPDYELVLIDVAIDQPVIDILLQQMRRDERTASLRVGLIARAGFRERAEHAERSDPLSKAFSRPNDDNMVNWQLDQLALLRPREFVDFDTRQRQAAEALDLLAELIRSPHRLYDLRGTEDAVLTALYTPKLSTKAIAVLAEMNSAESQRALIEVASRFTEPLELRAAAADAFCQNSKKHGLLLTTDEISRQYRRYNESETLDADTQRVLGQILDCIELPSRAAAGKNQASDNNQPQPK
jgi:CheY-like chemotaxis protein